jgi:hypothetical protein
MKDQVEDASENAIALVEQSDITTAYEANDLDPVLSRIEAEVALHKPDLSTKKGRDAVKSLAYKVARSKTLLDAAGKKLNEDAQAKIDKVNEQRKSARDRLDALRDRVRKPVEAWEEKEEARKAAHRERLKLFQVDRTGFQMSVAEIRAIISEVQAVSLGETWEEFQGIATEAQADALTKFGRDLQSATVREDQERQIAEMKSAAAERDAKDAAEKAVRDAKEAEERAAAEEQARKDQEAQDQIQREEFERQRQADIAAEAKAKAEREADEAEQRQSDYADILVKHVFGIGSGLIAGEPEAHGVLYFELTQKVPADAGRVGDHWPRVQTAIDAAMIKLDDLKAAADKAAEERSLKERLDREAKEESDRKERNAEHKRQLDAAAETERKRIAAVEQEKEEARARRAADDAHRTRVLKTVSKAMSEYPIGELAQAILDEKIPHVRMDL